MRKCAWCNERFVIDNDPDYYTCAKCLENKYKNKDQITVLKIYDTI